MTDQFVNADAVKTFEEIAKEVEDHLLSAQGEIENAQRQIDTAYERLRNLLDRMEYVEIFDEEKDLVWVD